MGPPPARRYSLARGLIARGWTRASHCLPHFVLRSFCLAVYKARSKATQDFISEFYELLVGEPYPGMARVLRAARECESGLDPPRQCLVLKNALHVLSVEHGVRDAAELPRMTAH